MRRLELDFHRPHSSSPWRWPLLVCGLAALAAVLLSHRQINHQLGADRAALQVVKASQPAPARAPSAADDAALAIARQAVAKSKQPWGELFATLEKADNKDVGLLAFTPDPARGQLRLYAEARNLGAMLAYHRRLEGGALRQVALVEHDLARDGGDAPVRFHIAAHWGTNHGRP